MLRAFKNLSLGKKQLVVLLAAGLVPMLLIAIISLSVAKGQVRGQALDQLEAVREIKAAAISRYFETVASQLRTMASATATADAHSVFVRSFERLDRSERFTEDDMASQRDAVRDYYTSQFGEEYKARNEGASVNIDTLINGLDRHTITAQYLYIANNPDPLGEKHLMDSANGQSVYHRTHAHFHPGTRDFLETFGFYDIFLIDIESGDIVYSVFKELDYGTSLRTGPYKDTNFARAFRRAAEMAQGEIAFEDFEQYRPSYDAPASFIASPVYDEGKRVGVLVFQIPLEPVNEIMSQRSGMGETGESYLVGEDLLMRSDSYLDPAGHSVAASFKHPESGMVDTEATRAALNGEKAEKAIIDYNGNAVLSAYSPLEVLGEKWAVLAEIDVAEAFAGVYGLQWTMAICWFGFAGALVFFALQVSRVITTPILALAANIQRVDETGRFECSKAEYAEDEVGQTSRAFDRLLASIGDAIQNTNQSLEAISKGDFSRKVPLHYQGDLHLLASGVNAASEQIQESNLRQQEQAEIASQKAIEAENQARETLVIKQAIDVSATSAMITDAELKIVYQNQSSIDLMSRCEDKIREGIPGFSAASLEGSSIEVFRQAEGLNRAALMQLRETKHSRMEIGGLTFDLATTSIRDAGGQFLGVVVEWEDKTESLARKAAQQVLADENARIRQALDRSSTATMITDDSSKLIYRNESFISLMTRSESQFSNVISGFSSRDLGGIDLSEVYKSPDHSISDSFSREFELGELNFSVASNPILSDKGDLLGSVVEWKDRTGEVRIEAEVDGLIASASQGDFSQRLNLDGKEGFFLSVSEGLNQVVGMVSSALEDMITVFSALSKGDLGKKVERDYMGDFGRLKRDANFMVDKLRETVESIVAGADSIANSSQDISDGNTDLSQRTEEQASSLEETAASMEEILRIVQNGQDNVEETTKLAQASIDCAHEGNQSVQETVHAMRNISESSNKIASIIGVIDEIAFQTNLLALNAAVEAARAGEQGKGFAVVASEVRNLAQRSADSAKQIKDLISDSVSRVDEGVSLVEQSGTTLAQIVEGIEGVAAKMEMLAESSKEQSEGIGQVNSSITQMDAITQQNAALVEEASASSQSMASEAQRLRSVVSFFSNYRQA